MKYMLIIFLLFASCIQIKRKPSSEQKQTHKAPGTGDTLNAISSKINTGNTCDLILFTGTDSREQSVGHMGIIISNDSIQTLFIHSASGEANGVTITPLNNYYKSHFVKVIRVFPQNNS